MTLAAKLYFDAMSKIGESAAVSPVSRELGKFSCCVLTFDLSWGFDICFLLFTYYDLLVDFRA